MATTAISLATRANPVPIATAPDVSPPPAANCAPMVLILTMGPVWFRVPAARIRLLVWVVLEILVCLVCSHVFSVLMLAIVSLVR